MQLQTMQLVPGMCNILTNAKPPYFVTAVRGGREGRGDYVIQFKCVTGCVPTSFIAQKAP